jgi:thiamine-phosphate pyrophosphorylase
MSRAIIRYAITDRSQYGSTERTREAGLLLQTEKLAHANIDFIQLREKDISAQDLLYLARQMLEILRNSGPKTRLLINSRVDIAAATGAHGVHLPSGEGQLTPAQAKQVLRLDKPVVSVSCHTLAEVQCARDNAADIILFGPVFGKSIAGNVVVPGTGLDGLAQACAVSGIIPVLALGGITLENTAACLDSGAKGIAAIRLFQII